jgi:hypothetical protein
MGQRTTYRAAMPVRSPASRITATLYGYGDAEEAAKRDVKGMAARCGDKPLGEPTVAPEHNAADSP